MTRPNNARWWVRAGIAAVVAGVLVAAVLLVPRVIEARARKSTPAAQAPKPPTAPASSRNARAELGEVDGDANIQCWTNLAAFDAEVSLATFRAWARPLIAAGDPLMAEYLVDRLAELVGDDEERAREVLAWVGDAEGEEMWLLLEGLERSPAIHRPAVADALARVGLAPDASDERRTAVFGALDTQKRLSPATLAGLTGAALADAPGDAGWVAARTVGRVMGAEVRAGGDAAPYMDQLLAIGTKSPDAQVRNVALEMPMHVDARVDRDAATRLAQIITGDPDPDVRKTAIHDLSLAIDGAQALQIYERAFAFEHDRCVRWALFRFTARVAGAGALPVMGRMAKLDATFASDYRTFELIYASGVVDFERVWQSLPNDDPHGCLHTEEGE